MVVETTVSGGVVEEKKAENLLPSLINSKSLMRF